MPRGKPSSGASTPAPASQRPRRSTRSSLLASKNSSPAPSAANSAASKRATRLSRGAAQEPNSETVSEVTTPADLTSDEASDFTPATSMMPTPMSNEAGQSAGKPPSFVIEVTTSRARYAESERALSLNAKGKRRADVVDDSDDDDDGAFSDESSDAKVARRLQEEEYAKAPSRRTTVPKHLQHSPRSDDVSPVLRRQPKREQSNSTPSGPSRPLKIARTVYDSLASESDDGLASYSDDSDLSDIDMDAEIAAAAAFDEGNAITNRKGVSIEISDSAGLSDSDFSIYGLSSDDEPLSKPKGKQGKSFSASRSGPSKRGNKSSKPRGMSSANAISIPSDESETASSSNLGDLPDLAAYLPDDAAGLLERMSGRRRGYRRGNKRRAVTERERLEAHHPELQTMWTDLEKMPVINAGRAEQPSTISRRLKPFQLEGLAWMKEMEKQEWRGGLLGDEMGLGKTIQAVSLIMSDYPAKQPTLVLVPPVALMQWQSEMKSYTDGTLKTFVFHGTNAKTKGMQVKDLKKYDVIMMSYNSLESIYRKQERGFKRKDGLYKEESVIHAVTFHRIILDEAHCIKTRTTMTAKACFALKTHYRWCLTGTPLQNRIGEFFSLIRFLNIKPFASYLCKQCPCSTLEWNMDEDNRCHNCGHGGMQHVSVFNQELLNPIQKFGNFGPGREAFRKLRLMTNRIMLRRLKKDHTNAMELPVKEVFVDRQFFGEEENDFASSIMTNGQRKFDTYVHQGVLLNNYANIFGLIMQMRQVADHPDLILKKNADGGQNVLICCICDEPAEDTVRSRCKHDFCRACVSGYIHSTDEPDCPRCHIPLSIDLEQPEIEQDQSMVKKSSIINRIKMENWTSSSKIELLVHELHKLRSDNASHKSIIFSQFTTMLQLVEWRLRRAGITTVMLDGSMTPAQRQASIEHFMNNVDVECFLVSLKAGGVALNLTEASRVFIVDPWWNPAAEWQSADRCHRIGQTRPCTITRLCIEDSVESRMVLIQEKKTSMIQSTVNGDDKAMESLTPQDMQFLFRGS
ncbi:DNA repair protein RAD16 [Cordyceps fumosorosea ARSEF 2679]|uniref:DNA repair protein RAD16 n=1 Tax=Cordyceps fumosorosea (strain ARSEF 2679) TaxID=1081104 RepID=A0A167P8D0_CORFA|nr:DNA repair protein RAD16 [Cordyceps fumosorosea ARSEF 2679]OAA56392.1 DNA repair protein RAD16 [Cordyceps fumosorosea ARSEF 2679]